MYGYIYITTNIINNKKYIGKHKSLEFDENYKGSGIRLNQAINKYGINNFTTIILEQCFSEEELNEKEIYWINYYDAVNDRNYYNIAEGGQGGNTYAGRTEEEMAITKMKISKANSGENNGIAKNPDLVRGERNGMYGKKIKDVMSEETYNDWKEKISNSKKGTKFSDEQRKKMSEYAKNRPEEHRKKISEALKNREKNITKVCAICGKEFKTAIGNAKYSSDCKIKKKNK